MNNKLARYGPLVFLLGLLLLGLFGFPVLLRDYLVRPVAISLWAIWRIIISVDQGVYWILLVALCALLMIRIFSASDHVAPAASDEQPARQRPTRVEHWRSLFRSAARTDEGDVALRASLRSLLAATIRQAHRPVGTDVAEALAARHITLPPRVRRYLELDDGSDLRRLRSFSLRSLLRQWLGRPPQQDSGTIDEVLHWMETALEITDDKE